MSLEGNISTGMVVGFTIDIKISLWDPEKIQYSV